MTVLSWVWNTVFLKRFNAIQTIEINTIHGFTISVPVLILTIFWQLLLRNGKMSSKCLFWKERTYAALNLYYLDATVISNQIKYYLTKNRENFPEVQYVFYRYALLADLLWLIVKEYLPRTQQNLERDCLEHHCERSLKLVN